ncbi:MAG: autotransporter-associated beta strand repeat-containing protein, partial [Chromatiales bacterium]|nr:autotransporter-associated beta strand repeat-containing protein [Chromatiales bacterium]
MSHDRKQQQASTAGADRLRAGSRPIALALLPLLFIGASQPAIAADVTWDAGTGDWAVGSNWVGGSAPAPADKAIIENGGTAQIGAGDSPSIDYFDIGAQENTSGTLDIQGGGELTVSGFMRVGNGAVSNGIGTLNVGAGSTLTRTGLFAFEVSGNGSTVNVSGADALWTGGVDNGVWGGGALNVDNGGRVDVSGLVANSGGEINITGAGTTVSTTSMYVGNFGAGTLTVADAAELTIAGGAEHFFLGVNHAAADGTLNIGTGGPAGILNVPAIEYGWGTARINFNHSDDISFGIPIDLRAGYAVPAPGTLSLSKQGTGTLDLTGDYGYTGDTTVSGGTLLVNGSITNSSTTVNSGGT